MKKIYIFLFSCVTVLSAVAQTTPNLYRAVDKEKMNHWVDSVFDAMSYDERIGQLFMIIANPKSDTRNMQRLMRYVNEIKIGGILFHKGDPVTQAEVTNRLQKASRVPMLVSLDGEWGLSMRLSGTTRFPKNMMLGAIEDNSLITEYGKEVARQCKEMGIHINFAPDMDVNSNTDNPVIGLRSFGENPEAVADKGLAYARGLEGQGILSVAKHFPGHGDTDVDSHKTLPVLPFTRERLDSVELHPFKEAIRAGLSGMMVGHLQVPVIEPIGGLPSSLSRNIVYDLLTEEFAFKGLIFTDALAMKGVSGNGNVSLQALKAGNDMVLAPRNLKEEIAAVLDAIDKGELTREDIEEKCRKVLTYKYVLGLKKKPFVQLSGLGQRINTPQTRDLIRRLNWAAITVLNNKNHILPLHADKEQKIALLEVGKPGETNALASQMSRYTSLVRFRLRANQTEQENQKLRDSLAAYKRIVVAVSEQRLGAYQPFFAKFVPKSPAIYLFFTPGKMMLQIQRAVSRASAVILGHSHHGDVQRQVADILYAKATADGRLSASIGGLFPTGAGVTITPRTPLHFIPEEHGLSSILLKKIDAIALDGIQQGAYPGCQIVVLRNGHIMYDKAFGTYAGKGSPRVESTDIYDLASLSKTTGTLLAIMKLYDKGRFSLTDKISDYLPFLQRTDKKDITIQEILLHQSGLPSWIPFYQEVIDKDSYDGRLFSARRDAKHLLRIGTTTWANPDFKFKKEYISSVGTGDYTVQICDSIWLNRSFRKVIEEKIAETPLRQKRYVYSDIGFILLGMLVEQLAEMPMEAYLQREFYGPMGLERTGYLPLRRFAKSEIVPSNKDRFLRKKTLQGFVHDEASAFFGGLGGNAGLFSTAREVARIYQMLLNGGELDGQRYLSKETCQLFTTEVSKISRRGLGFDKPDMTDSKKGNCAPGVPAEVYGHTGFTGTCAWVDPVNELVYVFLSNRVYPDATNRKLNQLHIRERIQEAIYDAMKKK
mgnify:CR=1 FL=1